MSDLTCQHEGTKPATMCGDPADRNIANTESPEMRIPMCGMHAMRFKPADGWTNEPIEVAE